MIRVLLVDDEPLVCSYLSTILRSAGDIEVVGAEPDGAAAVEAVIRLNPDVVLMDLRMPGVNGATAIRRIRQLGLRTTIITLTIFDTDASVSAALRAGADGFLLKSTPPGDFVNVVRVAAQGQTVLSASVTARLVAAASTDTAELQAKSQLAELTEREREVLALLSQGRSNAAIGADLDLTEATIKGYVSRLLIKLGVQNRTQAGLLGQAAGLARDTTTR